jgi:hypothetical protein
MDFDNVNRGIRVVGHLIKVKHFQHPLTTPSDPSDYKSLGSGDTRCEVESSRPPNVTEQAKEGGREKFLF